MGTRSLLGYELPNGKIYAQYLQFDGYPDGVGQEYYEQIVHGLEAVQTDTDVPSPAVFKRIQCWLNEAQYKSGHSVGNHHTNTREDWFGNKIDSWQEWQYLFTRKGDFIFSRVGKGSPVVTIPWGITRSILKEYHSLKKWKEDLFPNAFWEACKFEDTAENKKVLSWGKKAALHVKDDLDYDSSKLILEKLLRGEEAPPIREPLLRVDTGEALAFPDQGDNGWRSYVTLTVGTTLEPPKVTKSMFVSGPDNCQGENPTRNSQSYEMVVFTPPPVPKKART